ncbi:MAG: GAF domain-containing protein [Actinomycetia bacterium]|nr:GAF domain-containing protein [Actinomycetes bacterium]
MNFTYKKIMFVAAGYALLVTAFIYFLPPVVTAVLFLFLVVFSAWTWRLAGGLVAAAWSSIIIGISSLYLHQLSFINFLFILFAYFAIAVGLGKLSSYVREKQMKLEKNEGFLRQSQKAAGIGSYIVDISSGTWECSEVLCEIFGLDKKSRYMFEEWTSIIHPDYKDIILKTHNATYEESLNFDEEYKIIRKSNGQERWVYNVGKVIYEKNGNPAKLIGTILDITEMKKKDEKIIAQNKEFSVLNSLSAHLRTTGNSREMLTVILNHVCNLLKAQDGMVLLLTKDKKHIIVAEARGQWKEGIGKRFSSEQKLCNIMKQIDKTIVCNKLTALDVLHLDRTANLDHLIFTPLKSTMELLGILAIHRPKEPDRKLFSASNLQLLTTIGEMTGSALHRQQLHESTQRHLEEVQTLKNIDMAITGSLDIRVTYWVILDEITKHLNSASTAILRLDRHTGFLKYEDWRGFNVFDPKSINLNLGEGYAGRTASKRESVHIPDLKQVEKEPHYEQLIEQEGFASYYNAPLIVKGQVQGVLEIFHRKPVEHNEDWLSFLDTLAGQIAVAIDNADLFHNLELSNIELLQAYDSTIEGWAYALDLKDEETEGHSRRVTEMTLRIAQKLEVNKEELAHIRRGALLHDIGKMGIPDSILLKPVKLTEKEWEIMKKHPEHAFRMLSPVSFLSPALDIPYCHHERWDGTGYPRGLEGNQIPLAARIFAVADVYDALTSDRPYRKAWSKEKALGHIKQQSGQHFDPQVVETFITLLDQN